LAASSGERDARVFAPLGGFGCSAVLTGVSLLAVEAPFSWPSGGRWLAVGMIDPLLPAMGGMRK
jgi:hypothetical protein